MLKPSAAILFLCFSSVLFLSRPGQAREKITFTPKTPGQHLTKRDPCEIQVFQDSKPDRAYVDLGVINYHDERHRSKAGALTLEVALPQIKASACKVGADAVMNIRITENRHLEFAMFDVSAMVVRFEAK
jgi:hypothetical protein